MQPITCIGHWKAPPNLARGPDLIALLRGGHHPLWRDPADALIYMKM
jgi:hypothetical protein